MIGIYRDKGEKMSELLERDPKEQELAARHQRYRDLVEKDHYQEYANRTYGTNPYYKNREKTVLRPGDPDYAANRVKNASVIARGEYLQPNDYTQQAPAWDFMATVPEEQPEQVTYVETEDEKPTLTTAQYASVKEQKSEVAVDEYFALSASAKIVIAVLATVVLAIIALIWVNASVISTLSADTAAIEQQIASLSTQLKGINEQIAQATSEEAMMEFVKQAGMILG